MAYTTGKTKSLDDITLDDALKYPIWEWALDEEGEDGQDETWQRPIVDTDNVTDDIYNPTITIKINFKKILNLFLIFSIFCNFFTPRG